MSNQWLSNTFSMITSGILGKSNKVKGKDLRKMLMQVAMQS